MVDHQFTNDDQTVVITLSTYNIITCLRHTMLLQFRGTNRK